MVILQSDGKKLSCNSCPHKKLFLLEHKLTYSKYPLEFVTCKQRTVPWISRNIGSLVSTKTLFSLCKVAIFLKLELGTVISLICIRLSKLDNLVKLKSEISVKHNQKDSFNDYCIANRYGLIYTNPNKFKDLVNLGLPNVDLEFSIISSGSCGIKALVSDYSSSIWLITSWTNNSPIKCYKII